MHCPRLTLPRLPSRPAGLPAADALLQHLAAPAFILPQLLNLSGSVLFAAALAHGSISAAVPLANGVSLAANAVVDHLLGDRLALGPGLPALALVLTGVTLCTLSTASSA